MSKFPVFQGKRRQALTPSQAAARVAAVLLVVGVPAWAIATAGASSATAAVTNQPASTTMTTIHIPSAAAVAPNTPAAVPAAAPARVAAPAPAPQTGVSVASHGLADAFAAAVALQGAIVVKDWATATRQLAALKGVQIDSADAMAARAHLAPVTSLIDGLDATVKVGNARVANEQAYQLASTLMAALADRPLATGGGGGPATPPRLAQPMVALEHMRTAMQAAAQAQVSLLSHDTASAKTQLDHVRDEMKAASKASSNVALKGAIVNLDKQRWRTVAALGNASAAYRNITLLSHGLMRTMHLAGRETALMPAVAPVQLPLSRPTVQQRPAFTQPQARPIPPVAPGGGGGGKAQPILQDAPPPTNASRPNKQVALESTPYDKRDMN